MQKATTASIVFHPSEGRPTGPIKLHLGHPWLDRLMVIELIERALRRMPYKSDGLFAAVLIEEIAREYGTGSVRLDLYQKPALEPAFTVTLHRNGVGGMEFKAEQSTYTYYGTLPA